MKAVLTVLVFWLVAGVAFADHHAGPPHDWISKHQSGLGWSCCGKDDVKVIPYELALSLSLGSTYKGKFPGRGESEVIITKIYPSQDRYSYVTFFGCLFKPEFM